MKKIKSKKFRLGLCEASALVCVDPHSLHPSSLLVKVCKENEMKFKVLLVKVWNENGKKARKLTSVYAK